MLWDIQILLPTKNVLKEYRRSKVRDKLRFSCKQQQQSIELCCCIMSELEIRVVSTQLRGIDSIEVSVCGDQPGQRLIVDVCNREPSDHTRMQKDEEGVMMAQLLEEEEEEEDVLDEDLELFENSTSSIISTSRPETPVTTSTTPPIAIPLCSPLSPYGSGRLVSTPTHSSSFSYFCRMSPEATSPLSSGYGSAPRFFHTTATQTPPLSPVLHETQIRLRLLHNSSTGSQDSSHEDRVRLRRQIFRDESRRTRFFSEGSVQPADSQMVANINNDPFSDPLPDVVAFRDRANSAPARPVAPEIAAGRELRRIGDEFVNIFEGKRRNEKRRRSLILRVFDTLSATVAATPSPDQQQQTSTRDGSSV